MPKAITRTTNQVDRRTRRKQITRELLIAAATTVFDEKSVDKAVVKDITDEADVAYGTFYNHFESISEIAEAAVASKLRQIATEIEQFNSQLKDPVIVAASGVRVTFRLLRSDPTCNWFSQRVGTLMRCCEQVLLPFALKDLERAIQLNRASPLGTPSNCVRCGIWMVVGMYTESSDTNDVAALEDDIVRLYLSVIGADRPEIEAIVEQSRHFTSSLKK